MLALLVPLGVGVTSVHHVISDQVTQTKLNDLMNIIDAKYIHLLDVLKAQAEAVQNLAADEDVIQDAQSLMENPQDSKSLQKLNEHLSRWHEKSQLGVHTMKAERDKGTQLEEVFGREVHWEMYRLDERIYRYDEVFALNPQGIVVASSEKQNIGLDWSASQSFQKGQITPYSGDVYRDNRGKTVFDLSSPIFNKQNKLLGLVGFKISTDYLTDLVTGDLGNQVGGKLFFSGYTASTDFYLINEAGYMITQSQQLKGVRNTVLTEKSQTTPWQRCVDTSLRVREAQELYLNHTGIEVGGASMCLFSKKWTIVVEQNKGEILALADQALWILLATIGVTAAVISLLLNLIGLKFLIQPITGFSSVVQQVQRGDFSVRTNIRSQDEIGQLSMGLDQMVQELGTNKGELERKIASRTEALSKEVTERKLYEKELIAAKEVSEKASKAKSTFLTMMSHELRTPMNGVLGMARLLQASDLDPDQQANCDVIIKSGTVLVDILSDILDISKIEAGKQPVEKHLFSLKGVIGSTMDLFSGSATAKGLLLNYSLNQGIKNLLVGDSVLLRRILSNLLGNAVKFTHQGQIDLNVSVVEETVDHQELLFEVRDTGIGLDEKQQKIIFDPFRQADEANTRQFGGTGLGLTIVSNLLRLQGGEIVLESCPGKGSRFRFKLTYDISDEHPLDSTSEDPISTLEPFDSMHALLIEDDPMNQLVLEKMLKVLNISVDIAENGTLAMPLICAEKYDLIFMDILMPTMDGYESTTQIRNLDESLNRATPIIALTALVGAVEKAKCFELGMNAYVSKPLDLKRLQQAISQCISVEES